jgi:hypothetical protein
VRLVREEKPGIIHFSGHGAAEGIILRDDGVNGYNEMPPEGQAQKRRASCCSVHTIRRQKNGVSVKGCRGYEQQILGTAFVFLGNRRMAVKAGRMDQPRGEQTPAQD